MNQVCYTAECVFMYFESFCQSYCRLSQFMLRVNEWPYGLIRLIPQRTVDNNLGPDRLAGPKALDTNYCR